MPRVLIETEQGKAASPVGCCPNLKCKKKNIEIAGPFYDPKLNMPMLHIVILRCTDCSACWRGTGL